MNVRENFNYWSEQIYKEIVNRPYEIALIFAFEISYCVLMWKVFG